MSTNFPNPRNVFLPELPQSMRDKPEYKYLQDLKTALELQFTKQFDNIAVVRDAIDGHTGT